MWHLKFKIIPLINGATGIITTGFRKNLEAMPRKHSTDSLEQSAVFGTSHIIGEVLQSETECLSGADRRWSKGSTRKTRPVTRNGDDDDDNNNNIIIIIR
jgi:hypothetical protein